MNVCYSGLCRGRGVGAWCLGVVWHALGVLQQIMRGFWGVSGRFGALYIDGLGLVKFAWIVDDIS